ncbi:MAG: 6-phosphogluconolactonase [Candidatus Promineifilaceae bacterium]
MNIEIFSSTKSIARFALHEILVTADTAIKERRLYSLVLSGGGTPEPLFRLFATPPFRDTIPWQHIHLFWGDERCVPPDQEGSSYFQALTLFINSVPIPPQNVHRAQGELPPQEAAENYRRQLAQFNHDYNMKGDIPRFDMVLLGMGSDGHTASLFPDKVPLEAATETVVAVTADYDGRPANRVTMTPPVFNNARNILFLVAGESKAQAVSAVLHGPHNPHHYPAQLIHPTSGQLTWLLDKAAASLIDPNETNPEP